MGGEFLEKCHNPSPFSLVFASWPIGRGSKCSLGSSQITF